MRARNMRFGVGALVTVIAVLGAGATYLFSQHEKDRALAGWHEKLALIADARTREVNGWMSGQFRELSALADNASLQIYFSTLADAQAKPGAQGDYLRNLLVLTSQRLGFEPDQPTINQQIGANVRKLGTGGLALVTMDGKVVMATAHMPPIEDAMLEKLQAAERGAMHFWDQTGADETQSRLVFSVPVYSVQASKDAASQIGMLVGIRPLQDVYGALALTQPAPEKSLEVALVRAESEGARYLSPLIGGLPLLSQREVLSENSAANYAVAHPNSFAEKIDYRGARVLIEAREIPATGWTLIAKVDRAEALGATLAKRNSIVAAAGMLLLALIATIVAVMRSATARQQALLASEFGAQAEMLSVVTDHQLEPLYIVDEELHLHFTNRRACEMMKSPASYLKGKSVDNVIGAAFAAQIQPLVSDAIRTGEPQTLALTRGAGEAQRNLFLRFIPLENIPVPDVAQGTAGVLIAEQDTTEVIHERELRLNTLNQLVAMLVSLVDKRDPHAAEHSSRVAAIARAISEGMGLTPEAVETTETAARLMNLGKVDVPVELLMRDGKLNDAERDVIRHSLSASADLLKGVAFVGPVADTLRQAQEYVDGSGPLKLKGEDILISARIIAVANALVSMASPRAYRSAMDCDAALKILQAETAKRFDRKVLSALLHYLDNQGGRELLSHKAA